MYELSVFAEWFVRWFVLGEGERQIQRQRHRYVVSVSQHIHIHTGIDREIKRERGRWRKKKGATLTPCLALVLRQLDKYAPQTRQVRQAFDFLKGIVTELKLFQRLHPLDSFDTFDIILPEAENLKASWTVGTVRRWRQLRHFE